MVVQYLNDEARKGRFPPLLTEIRESLLKELLTRLEHDATSVLLLVGEQGVGRRALIQMMVNELIQMSCRSRLRGTDVFLSEPQDLIPEEGSEKLLGSRLYDFESLGKGFNPPIACIPDIGHLLEGGVRSGDLADWLRAPGNKWILTVTPSTYQRYIASNQKWQSREFRFIDVPQLDPKATRAICQKRETWFRSIYEVEVESGAVDTAIELCKEHRADIPPPHPNSWPGVVISILEKTFEAVPKPSNGLCRIRARDVAHTISEMTDLTIDLTAFDEQHVEEPRPAPVPQPEEVVTEKAEPEAVASDPLEVAPAAPPVDLTELLECLLCFVHEVHTQLPELGEQGEWVTEEGLEPDQLRNLDPRTRQKLLLGILQKIDNLLRAARSFNPVEAELLRETTDFVYRINELVLNQLSYYARFLLVGEKQIQFEKQLEDVLPQDSSQLKDVEEVQQFLQSLTAWLEDILVAVLYGTRDAFKEMREKLEPAPKDSMEKHLQILRERTDEKYLTEAWLDKIKSRLRGKSRARSEVRRRSGMK
jgi:hypothetical protein